MPLTPGARLGPYEIVTPLGAGGMGEVWRARDPRLGRDVAIKALPDAFAQDPERLARFEREARVLASLSHPNVAGIHGLEEFEGHRYLVLELVEGETLAARLSGGPLSVDEALDVCRQVAAGVEAAHEAGIVHRDLKPGNVMVKADGSVKVLDFGLAKSGASDRTGSDPNLSASPTMTAAATSAGVILGTAAYMSPEQARGRAVDKRSDIWSFGCVLYECLTARPVFEGETVSDTIASILKTDPDLSKLPADTPPRVRELLARCLTRDAKERLRDIGEARVLLGAADSAPAPGGAAAAPVRGPGIPVGLAAGGALALAAIAVLVTLFTVPKRPPAPVRRLDLLVGDVAADWFVGPRLSPDGRSFAYLADNKIWVRRFDQLEARSVADLEDLAAFCWSPDSREIAYDDRKQLWRVPASGGTPVAVCAIPGTGGAIGVAWSDRGVLALSVWRGGLWTVPAVGGDPRLYVDIEPGKIVDFHSPSWLPNGDLMYSVHWTGAPDSADGAPHDLEVFAGGRRIPIRRLLGDDSQPLVTRSGRLLFMRRGVSPGVWEVAYDARTRRTSGEPRLVAPGAVTASVTDDGLLLYTEGGRGLRSRELVRVDRSGKVLASTGPAYPGLTDLSLSPDGRRVAFVATQDKQQDVWVRDFARGVDTRITFSKADEYAPHWIGPGRLSYVVTPEGPGMQTRIRTVNADGSGSDRELAAAAGSSMQDAALAPDGRTALRVLDETGHGRLRRSAVLPDGTLGAPEPFLRFTPEPDVEGVGMGGGGPVLSPDGRLVAYSNRDQQPEVFLARFPGGEGPWQVSTEGGRSPAWAPDSRALYYVSGSGPSRRRLMEVAIDPSLDPPTGRATPLYDLRTLNPSGASSWSFAVVPGGRELLAVRDVPDAGGPGIRLVLVENWESGLAPAGPR